MCEPPSVHDLLGIVLESDSGPQSEKRFIGGKMFDGQCCDLADAHGWIVPLGCAACSAIVVPPRRVGIDSAECRSFASLYLAYERI